jgi:hypothetical protein
VQSVASLSFARSERSTSRKAAEVKDSELSSRINSLSLSFPAARFRITLSTECSARRRITLTGLK